MLGSIYTAQAGLQAFSRGLDTISNNVANLNTPGHKANEILFQETFYRYLLAGDSGGDALGSQVGSGVKAERTSMVFSEGELQADGTSTHAAIDGPGFFILRENGNTYYTRNGKFEFDDSGHFVASGSSARVAGLRADGSLYDVSLEGLRSQPARPTTEITFSQYLVSAGASHSVKATVYDTLGGSHQLTLNFTNNSAVTVGSWLVSVTDENSHALLTNGEIRFNTTTGAPASGYNTLNFNFTPTGAGTSSITLNFGAPGSLTGATQFAGSGASTLTVASQNGYAVGALTQEDFDRNGVMKLTYSNGQKVDGPRLALAIFQNPQHLQQLSDGRFLPGEGQVPIIAGATEQGLGQIVGGKVELSNVDLTQQFTNMIIVQRGYQGASQIVTVANEMIQQLMDMLRGPR